MKLLCWNVRGVGWGNNFRVIKKLVRKKRVGLLGLVETIMSEWSDQFVKRLWKL